MSNEITIAEETKGLSGVQLKIGGSGGAYYIILNEIRTGAPDSHRPNCFTIFPNEIDNLIIALTKAKKELIVLSL